MKKAARQALNMKNGKINFALFFADSGEDCVYLRIKFIHAVNIAL